MYRLHRHTLPFQPYMTIRSYTLENDNDNSPWKTCFELILIFVMLSVPQPLRISWIRESKIQLGMFCIFDLMPNIHLITSNCTVILLVQFTHSIGFSRPLLLFKFCCWVATSVGNVIIRLKIHICCQFYLICYSTQNLFSN